MFGWKEFIFQSLAAWVTFSRTAKDPCRLVRLDPAILYHPYPLYNTWKMKLNMAGQYWV